MRKAAKIISTAASVAALLGSLGLASSGTAVAADSNLNKVQKEGKKLAFNRKKGNCLACHQMDDGTLPGNMGPPLVNMKARFPNKADLRAQIWDSTKRNPDTTMPPFGRHNILSEEEIDKIVEYVYTL